jgi:hypothetical protein
LIGGDITSSGIIKCNLNSETSLGTIGTTDKLYPVGIDSNGKLAVHVPWKATTVESGSEEYPDTIVFTLSEDMLDEVDQETLSAPISDENVLRACGLSTSELYNAIKAGTIIEMLDFVGQAMPYHSSATVESDVYVFFDAATPPI